MDRAEREQQERQNSPSSPPTLITDNDDIEDVDESSAPIAPQVSEKSPAPKHTHATTFAVSKDSGEVRMVLQELDVGTDCMAGEFTYTHA